ncbi:ExbD/TolR family protein [Rhodopirellula sallentina]|nr:biopolymer transporter ExbD [Rhodopirellula sallentina]
MTPMVDVTFLLLIFFMVTASFSMQKSIAFPRQESNNASTRPIENVPPEMQTIEVQIDRHGGFLVLSTDWQREALGKQNLLATLKEAAQPDPQSIQLVANVHESAKLQYLVDCLDAASIAEIGETKVVLDESAQ